MAIRVISSSRRKSERQSRRLQMSVAQRVRRKNTRHSRLASRRALCCVPEASMHQATGPAARNAACVTFATGCWARSGSTPALRRARNSAPEVSPGAGSVKVAMTYSPCPVCRSHEPGRGSPPLACISHHPTVEAHDTTARTSLRLLAVLDVLSSTPARAKRLAPFSSARLAPSPGGPLTHFASPRGEKCRLKYPA